MCDIMPELNKLAKMFQKDDFDYLRVENSKSYFSRLLVDYNSCKVLQTFNNDVINVLNDFITEDRGRGTFDFRNDLYKPYLQALIESIDQRFLSTDVLETFGIFDPTNCEDAEVYDAVRSLDLLSLHTQDDPTLTFDCATAEAEWLSICNELVIENESKKRSEIRKCHEVMEDIITHMICIQS